jgi:hypothetical protein
VPALTAIKADSSAARARELPRKPIDNKTYPKTLGRAGKRKRASSFSLVVTTCQKWLIFKAERYSSNNIYTLADAMFSQ